MYNEFQTTEGNYSQKGIGLFFAVLFVYYLFNVSLELFFGIVVYPTKLSSGFGMANFIAITVVAVMMYCFGYAMLKLKTIRYKNK